MVTESTRARRPGHQTVSSHMSIVQTEALSAIGGGHDGDRMGQIYCRKGHVQEYL